MRLLDWKNHYPWTWQNKTKIVTLDEVESWVPSKIGDDRKKASADAGVARKKEQRLTIMLHTNFMEHWPFFSHKFNLSRGERKPKVSSTSLKFEGMMVKFVQTHKTF